MAGYPKSERDARARARRKLKALRRRAHDLLLGSDGVAGLFEEGPVSSDIDRFMDELDVFLVAIEESIDDEVSRAEERE